MKAFRRATDLLAGAMILGYAAFLALRWESFPETVPSHFNAAGQPDAWGSRNTLLIEVAVAAGLFLLFFLAERHPAAWSFPVKVTEENRERLYRAAGRMLGLCKVLTVALVIHAGLSAALPGWPMGAAYVLTILLFAVIVFGMAECVRAR